MLELVGFALYCHLKIIRSFSNFSQSAQMSVGMNGFSRPRSPKKFGNLWIALLLSLVSEGEIFTVW